MDINSLPSVTCGDIRLHTRKVLDRVFQGETIVITRYKKPVAVLVPWTVWESLQDDTDANTKVMADHGENVTE